MRFKIQTQDPFKILSSTKAVVEQAGFVKINKKALLEVAEDIENFLNQHTDFPDRGHNLTGDFEQDCQLVFFESMLGFCFWALPGKLKWAIKTSEGETIDGWYGVCAAFKRAYDEKVPVTDAVFLAKADKVAVRKIFRSATTAEIPLLNERLIILNQNADVLLKQFGGQVTKFLEAAEFDVVKLFKLLVKYFPSYKDFAKYKGKEVIFLKIAHLLALDLQYRLLNPPRQPLLSNFDKLCVFADYKLPQLLRMFGVLEYEKGLADTVDSFSPIPAGSQQEVEIRAGTVWGIELLRQLIPDRSSVEVGHVVWLKSQDQNLQSKIKPYHRTLTTFY